jgi:SLT domain-containing protein
VAAFGVLVAFYAISHATSNSASAATSSTPATSAQVQSWISQADTVLAATGTPMTPGDNNDIAIIIAGESGGDPSSINHWDSNAAAGHPSEGLTQTIKPTFDAHCAPGYCANILDPVSNIVAGVRYALGRYGGSLDNVPGVIAVNNHRKYVGY